MAGGGTKVADAAGVGKVVDAASVGKVAEVAGRVVENAETGPGVYRLVVEAPEVAVSGRPGQFVMLRGWPGHDPLLPRPFSFSGLRAAEGVFEVTYRVVGKATALMADWHPGRRVDVRGPLGNGFVLPVETAELLAVVGRGMGLAPLMCLAHSAAERGFRVWAFLSARTAANLRPFEALRGIAARVWVATDDGSEGIPGLVTDALAAALEAEGMQLGAAYCCGSRRLARALGSIRQRASHLGASWFPVYVALEQFMACGVGHCQGCAVPVAEAGNRGQRSYARVCREGPVFPLERLMWE